MFFFFFYDNDKQNFCLQDSYFQTSVRNFSVWKKIFFSCKYKKVFGLGKYKNFFSLAGKSVLSGGHKKLFCLGKKKFFLE